MKPTSYISTTEAVDQPKINRLLTVTSDVAVRYLTAGTPTASYGHLVPANETIIFSGGEMLFGNVKFISTSGTATLTMTLETFAEA